MEDRREFFDRKFVSRCRERAGQVYYGTVFEIKKEIRVWSKKEVPAHNLSGLIALSYRSLHHSPGCARD